MPAESAPTPTPASAAVDMNTALSEEVLCGPISLALIARKLGREADLHEIASNVKLTAKGCSMEDLAGAASSLQLEAVSYKLTSAKSLLELRESTPAIVLLRKNHFAVVWGEKDKGNLWIAEYPNPIRKVAASEFGSDWDPRILVVSKPGGQDDIYPTPIYVWAIWGMVLLFGCLLIRSVFKVFKQRRDAIHPHQ